MESQDEYTVLDPEAALKYAIRQTRLDRVEIVEGWIEPQSRCWLGERIVVGIRKQLRSALDRLDGMAGAGDLDLPGSLNWFIPRLAIVPRPLAERSGTLLPSQTMLIVEVATEFAGDHARDAKRRRYAEYGAPLYLLVDRQERSCTLFSQPGELGYTRVDGPLPFGTPVPLPEPFNLAVDTAEMA
ncbi:Uma2 family endonuclease [Streptomyces mayteni]